MKQYKDNLEFVIGELKKRPEALKVIYRMLDFEKRYMLPVTICFPNVEKTSDINEVLENWKSKNPQELNRIELLWSKSGLSKDRNGNFKRCPNSFFINNMNKIY